MKTIDLNSGKQLISAEANLNLRNKKFMVGNVEYEPSDTNAYFTFTLLHSWPEINDNQVSFSAKTIERSFATAKHSPIDVDHKMEGNGIPLFDGNQIIGHMVDAGVEVEDGVSKITIAGVLYKRIAKAVEIITDIASGGSDWKISMEVLYNPSESGFMIANNTFVSLETADEDLVSAFQSGSSLYNGERFAFLAGGLGEDGDDANVNFWGAALTMSPADENATIHTMVARRLPKALIGADAPRVILFSDGSVESTRLLIDGFEVENLTDVDFSSWPGWDEAVYLSWSTEPQDIGGVIENKRYTLIANEIIGDIGMSKIKELLEAVPGRISEAVKAALATKDDGTAIDLSAVEAVIAEKIGELKDFISPAELETKAEELATKKIEDRDALAAKIKERTEKAEKAGVVMTELRLKEIAALEDDKVDEWIKEVQGAFEEMVASLEKKNGITLGEDITNSLKSFSGINSPEFMGYSSAVAMVLKNGASLNQDAEESGEDDNKKTPTGF